MAVAHRVYAEALFQAAAGQGRLAEVREDGKFVAAVGARTSCALLRNPQIEPHVKHDAPAAALEGADQLVRNFLLLLAEKGRIAEVEEIQREPERLVAQGPRAELELTTAIELSDPEAARSSSRSSRHPDGGSRPRAGSTPTSSAESSSRPARCASTRACAAGSTSYGRN